MHDWALFLFAKKAIGLLVEMRDAGEVRSEETKVLRVMAEYGAGWIFGER